MSCLLNPRLFIILTICIFFTKITFGQPKPKQDTALKDSTTTLQDSFAIPVAIPDTSAVVLAKKIETITTIISETNSILHRGFDTTEIAKELPELEGFVNQYAPSVLSKQGLISLRYIKTLKSFLLQYHGRLEKWQSTLHTYAKEMIDINNSLNTIIKDSAFNNLPEDSTLRSLYLKQLLALHERWQAADSSNKINLQKISILQNRVTNTALLTNETLDEIVYMEKNFQNLLWSAEEPVIWNINEKKYDFSFWEMSTYSFAIVSKIIVNFFLLSASHTTQALILMLAIYVWLIISLRRLKRNNMQPDYVLESYSNVSRFSVWLALLIFFTVLPFTYTDPPPSFIVLFTVLVAILYTVIKYNMIAEWLRKYWLGFFVIFLAVNYAVLLVRPTYSERIVLIILSIVALAGGFVFLITSRQHKKELPKYGLPLIVLFLVLMFAGFIANLVGCFALSKYFMISAVNAVVYAQVFSYLVQIIVETIYVLFEAHKNSIRAISRIDFSKIKQSLVRFFSVVAIIAWAYLLLRNLNFYDSVYDSISDFFNDKRQIGNASFSFGSIFIFILVIWLSTVISKLIITIVGLQSENISGSKKSKWGSFLLLARLTILGAGTLLAFAASGIPVDKLTIIIGALGVGIGFGLQNIVNNLVSGVILAFERPIHVGDAIEVGNRYGTVKEIGIRSSKLTTVEGSEVIVPNGDLLSQHIVNWTLSSQYRRVEIIIGVGYNTKLEEAILLVNKILWIQEGIEKNPAPLVLVHNFNSSSVDIRLLFWSDINNWVSVKSEVMIKVFDTFRENNINIPFPQQDVHIKSFVAKPGDASEKIKDK